MTLSVAGQTITSDGSGVLKMSNISAPDAFGASGPGTIPDFISDDYVRVIGTSKKGGTNKYVFTNFFRILAGGTTPITDLSFTDTPPKKPDMLGAVPDAPTLTAIGQTTQVRVTATYSDTTTAELPGSQNGTSYRISNVAVARVDNNGLVTVTGEGLAYITAVNEGATGVTGVIVTLTSPQVAPSAVFCVYQMEHRPPAQLSPVGRAPS